MMAQYWAGAPKKTRNPMKKEPAVNVLMTPAVGPDNIILIRLFLYSFSVKSSL